jgi:lysyl-tRNA synthetase class I
MSSKEDLKVLSEEEVKVITAKLEEEGDFTSDLARSMFTMLIISIEYHNCMVTLQAYQQASQEALHDYAGASAQVIGLRDMKKIQKLYKLAGRYAAGIESRVSTYLSINDIASNVEENKEETNDTIN